MQATTTAYGMTPAHGLVACQACGIWHCPCHCPKATLPCPPA